MRKSQALTQSEASQIHLFDASFTGLLKVIPDEETKFSFYVSAILPDIYRHKIATRTIWEDWMSTIAPKVKLAEIFMLWKDGALALCLVSRCSWAYSSAS